ncbi:MULTISPECIES: DUF2306 domain-containing protein [Paenibacillus]|uniref:DUF2306 domain-containing protein n=1 Tax=Paenibacillus TaxID=44249 RepID=UPI001356CD48|nr:MULTISPECIES: DUF2306 domain-containing protein [Paenibacillus]
MRRNKKWWLLAIVSLGVMIPFVAPYFTLNPSDSRVATTSTIQYLLLVTHIMFACAALLSGFFQFIDRMQINSPQVHRIVGRIYVCSVFVSGGIGLAYVFYMDNFSKAMSFLVLSLLWIFTCWKGLRAAIQRDIHEHRKWMTRNFGVTLIAVSGRLVVPLLLLSYYVLNGFSLPSGRNRMVEEVLNVNIWVGIVVNFIIIEWRILKQSR